MEVGIEYNEVPIGLGVIEKIPQEKLAILHSIFIESTFRHKNLGTKLLVKLEEELLKDSADHIERFCSNYPCKNSSSIFLEKMLIKQNWKIEDHHFVGKMVSNPHFPKKLYLGTSQSTE